jgi:hypothetical protein
MVTLDTQDRLALNDTKDSFRLVPTKDTHHSR